MRFHIAALAAGLSLWSSVSSMAAETGAVARDGIQIDVPVRLSEARVVFNLDHNVFNGDEPIGLQFLKVMIEDFKAVSTKWTIIAIFHGPNGYMALKDAPYDRVRHWEQGNPYKNQIEALRKMGVQVELCAETMRLNNWRNDDVLSGIQVNTGANLRLIELRQQGFIEIHP